MFTAQGAQLPLRTKSAAKLQYFFDICKRSCDFLKKSDPLQKVDRLEEVL